VLLSHTLTVSFNLSLSSSAWRYDMAWPSFPLGHCLICEDEFDLKSGVSSNAPAVGVHVDTCFKVRLIQLYDVPSVV